MKTRLRIRFGKRIQTLRQSAGISQEEFAEKAGFARSYVSRIERGGANPSLDAIETLADTLRVRIEELFKD